MKEILKYAAANRIIKGRNPIIKKSIDKKFKNDRVVKIITKEITEFIALLFRQKNKFDK